MIDYKDGSVQVRSVTNPSLKHGKWEHRVRKCIFDSASLDTGSGIISAYEHTNYGHLTGKAQFQPQFDSYRVKRHLVAAIIFVASVYKGKF